MVPGESGHLERDLRLVLPQQSGRRLTGILGATAIQGTPILDALGGNSSVRTNVSGNRMEGVVKGLAGRP